MRITSRPVALLAMACLLAAAHPAAASVTAGAGGMNKTIPAQASAEGQDQAPQDAPSAPPSTPPPAHPSPPPTAEPAPSATPPGQWAFTTQYGWLWMPYADVYTYAPPDGWGQPYEYVYWPAYGWTWVAAPWVWGFGPWPFFGVIGPVHFGWWGHGWWRAPWRWHFVPAPARGHGFAHGPPLFRHGPGGFVRAPPARSVPFRAPGAGWGMRGRR